MWALSPSCIASRGEEVLFSACPVSAAVLLTYQPASLPQCRVPPHCLRVGPGLPNFYNATYDNSASLVALPACNQSELLLGFAASFSNGETLLGSSWASGTNPCRDGWRGVACDGSGRVTSM